MAILYTENLFNINSLNIATKVWGKDNGQPILALHGWLDNAATFDRLAPLLPDLKLIAIDFPGHGHSSHLPNGSFYHYIDMVPLVFSLADHLKLDKFTLLGHSMGAGVATLMAGTDSERILKLILVDGLGPLSDLPEQAPKTLLKSLQHTQLLKGKKLSIHANMQEAVVARKKVGNLTEESAKALVSRGSKPTKQGVIWRSDPRLTTTSRLRLTEEQVHAFLSQIKAPTLLIRDESGLTFAPEIINARCQKVKNLQLEIMPGGHYLHLENPVAVAKLINAFLK